MALTTDVFTHLTVRTDPLRIANLTSTDSRTPPRPSNVNPYYILGTLTIKGKFEDIYYSRSIAERYVKEVITHLKSRTASSLSEKLHPDEKVMIIEELQTRLHIHTHNNVPIPNMWIGPKVTWTGIVYNMEDLTVVTVTEVEMESYIAVDQAIDIWSRNSYFHPDGVWTYAIRTDVDEYLHKHSELDEDEPSIGFACRKGDKTTALPAFLEGFKSAEDEFEEIFGPDLPKVMENFVKSYIKKAGIKSLPQNSKVISALI